MAEKLGPNPFSIGAVVWIIGRYVPDGPDLLFEAKISPYIKHRQFVAYRVNGAPGEWRFSRKDFNKCVFLDPGLAVAAWEQRRARRENL